MADPVKTGTNFSPPDVYVGQDANDIELVTRCLEGDTAAFAPIVERYQRVLFTVARRMLGDAGEADDAAQNAFVKAYQNLRGFDRQRRFFSWLYRILLNECLNRQRDRRAHEALAPELAVAGSPVEALERKERRARVQAAILALPVEYREVVVLRHFAELSYDEIADTLGLPAARVKSRLYIARQRLSQLLLGEDA
jgi:RNA polymerase sigma-70 factor (ECF subfamily)